MKKTTLALILILVLVFSAVIVTWFTNSATAQTYSTITIKPDGSITGTDKIQRMGNVYTFAEDISVSIIVERDNIVIDGAGYTLIPQNDATVGVDIRNRSNVTVENLTVKGVMGNCGIFLFNAINCTIARNNLTGNFKGIEMAGASSRNRITENIIQSNQVGMEVYSVDPGSDNAISENEVANNRFGMQIKDFLNTNVSGNKITSNAYGLGLGVGSGSIAKNNVMDNNTYGFYAFNIQRERGLDTPIVNVTVDASNTVNGKPIYYWVDQHDKTISADAGYVALIGCSGITVKNLNLSSNNHGVFLGSTTNSTITNNNLSNNLFGVYLDASSNNTISGNSIVSNEKAINLCFNSSNNTIQGNNIARNTVRAIYVHESSSNKIIENNITNNHVGVYTDSCEFNIIYHNNFVENTKQWDDVGFTEWRIPLPFSISIWDNGTEGNYWSDYSGRDADGDGIGDSPYVIKWPNNIDHYPLMAYYNPDVTDPVVGLVSPENKTYYGENIELTFTINENVSWMSYSLNGQDNLTIAGNTTLSKLPNGYYNLRVYATDLAGNTGASENLYFSVEVPEPFPTTLLIGSIISAVVVVGLGLLVYFKKRNAIRKP